MALFYLDLDDTIADSISEIDKITNVKHNWNSYYQKDIDESFFLRNTKLFEFVKPIKRAIPLLYKIMENHGLIIISKRPAVVEGITTNWLKRNGFPDIQVYLTNDKVSICKKLDVRFGIEDAPYEIDACQKAGIKMLVKAQQYNMSYDNRFDWLEDDFWPVFNNVVYSG